MHSLWKHEFPKRSDLSSLSPTLSAKTNDNDEPKALRLFDQTTLFQSSNIDLCVLGNRRIASHPVPRAILLLLPLLRVKIGEDMVRQGLGDCILPIGRIVLVELRVGWQGRSGPLSVVWSKVRIHAQTALKALYLIIGGTMNGKMGAGLSCLVSSHHFALWDGAEGGKRGVTFKMGL